jgi:hypothetical protein
MQKTYEAPRLTTVGSIKDLTLGSIGFGNQDRVNWFLDIFLS